jgi:hypothetical protein
MHKCVCIWRYILQNYNYKTTFPKPLYIPHSACIHRDPGYWKSWCLNCLWPLLGLSCTPHLMFHLPSLARCCPQSHQNLFNKGLKYWDPGLNELGSRTFIATVHNSSNRGRLKAFRKRKDKAKLGWEPNLLLNWVPCPVEAQCTFFFFCYFFEISSPV